MMMLSEAFILFFLSVSLSCTPYVLMQCLSRESKALTLGISTNVCAVIFGGTSPLLVQYLSQYGQACIGLVMSLGGLSCLLAFMLNKWVNPNLINAQPS